jgi:hypothetical protein
MAKTNNNIIQQHLKQTQRVNDNKNYKLKVAKKNHK